MIVVGGIYREYCSAPHWDEYYGSGGRAAAALARANVNPLFVSCANDDASTVVEARGEAIGYRSSIADAPSTPLFTYWTPLHQPSIYYFDDRLAIALPVEDDVVLRFGMLEATGIVKAKRAVYDPQSEGSTERFEANGSYAEQYAVVANAHEVRAMGEDQDIAAAARNILNAGASVVFVKNGPFGVTVHWNGLVERVPAFRTKSAFTIGSGDVFSAAIAYHWGINGESPVDSAYLASHAVAEYVETRGLVLNKTALLASKRPEIKAKQASVYIAGPFFDLGQRRMIEDVRDHLIQIGMSPNSPLHDIGFGRDVARKDIELLKRSDVVLALLDGTDVGTVFEVGYARAIGKPVVVFTQRTSEMDLTMITGTDCAVYDDYVAAIYATAWSG